MAEAIKVLAQDADKTSITDLYTVPASTETVLSSIVICNRSNATRAFRLAVAPAGAADSVEHYQYYDVDIGKNDTFAATLGITLAATDVIRWFGDASGLSISVYGTELS